MEVRRDREDAREVFQETWLRAFERLESLREPRRLRSWLLSIALNLARQRLRRASPEPLDEACPEAAGTPGGVRVGEELEREELLERTREEIEALPPRQREVVRLRIQQGLSHGEIAALLGIREENARANYYQGLRRLRERFRDHLSGEDER